MRRLLLLFGSAIADVLASNTKSTISLVIVFGIPAFTMVGLNDRMQLARDAACHASPECMARREADDQALKAKAAADQKAREAAEQAAAARDAMRSMAMESCNKLPTFIGVISCRWDAEALLNHMK
jgi:hypothetical protein